VAAHRRGEREPRLEPRLDSASRSHLLGGLAGGGGFGPVLREDLFARASSPRRSIR
jgi:hypothetical protein